jgi:hypothetical protein
LMLALHCVFHAQIRVLAIERIIECEIKGEFSLFWFELDKIEETHSSWQVLERAIHGIASVSDFFEDDAGGPAEPACFEEVKHCISCCQISHNDVV